MASYLSILPVLTVHSTCLVLPDASYSIVDPSKGRIGFSSIQNLKVRIGKKNGKKITSSAAVTGLLLVGTEIIENHSNSSFISEI